MSARRRAASATVAFATVLSIASSVAAYPHSLSYFNELAGGPLHASEHLLDVNVDWGQDVLFLKRWCASHRGARPLYLQYFGFPSNAPEIAGMEFHPIAEMRKRDASRGVVFEPSLQPGWYAISINDLHGYRHYGFEGPWFSYLRSEKPVASAGYSILIYHLSAADVKRIRARASVESANWP
jgi:hypothetical protein